MSGSGPLGYAVRLLREGTSIAASNKVASLVMGLVAAAVTVVVLATTGQSAATQEQVLSTMSGLDARVIQITDTDGQASIKPDTVGVLQSLSGVETVIGLGPARDIRTSSLPDAGTPVPLRNVYGALPPEVSLDTGRLQRGDVIIGSRAQAKLGLQHAAGGVTDSLDQKYPVSGAFHSTGYLRFLDRGALTRQRPDATDTVSEIFVVAERPEDVDTLLKVLPGAVVATKPSYTVEASEALIRARDTVSDNLADAARGQLQLSLGAAVALQAITMTGAVSQRRRDFGRRRSLGASRSAVVVLVLAQTVLPAALGAALGAVAGGFIVQHLTNALPPLGFTVGVATLAVLSAAAAAIPPALLAALRDPVRILRVP